MSNVLAFPTPKPASPWDHVRRVVEDYLSTPKPTLLLVHHTHPDCRGLPSQSFPDPVVGLHISLNFKHGLTMLDDGISTAMTFPAGGLRDVFLPFEALIQVRKGDEWQWMPGWDPTRTVAP